MLGGKATITDLLARKIFCAVTQSKGQFIANCRQEVRLLCAQGGRDLTHLILAGGVGWGYGYRVILRALRAALFARRRF